MLLKTGQPIRWDVMQATIEKAVPRGGCRLYKLPKLASQPFVRHALKDCAKLAPQ